MNRYRVIRLAHFSIRLLPQRLAIMVTLTLCLTIVAVWSLTMRQPIYCGLLLVVVIDRWK